jgi:imidazoleglycerol-phosphate dehydratase
MRYSKIERSTSETVISCSLELDGSGKYDIATGCGFLDHMLELFARHGRFDLTLRCSGDTRVDCHHTVEDVGIVLGRAFSEALGDRAGIRRYGYIMLPMDESLVAAALDISGRSCLCFGLDIPAKKVGDFDTELVEEFFAAFARELKASIHLLQMAGGNSHHIIEAAFKGFARALSEAVGLNTRAPGEIPSTKGTIL